MNAPYRRLLQHVWPYRYAFVAAIVGNILYGLLDALLAKWLEPLLNEGFVGRNEAFIAWIPFGIVFLFLFRGIAAFLSTFFMGWVSRKVIMDFRQKMFQHLLCLPASYYDRVSSGEVLSRLTYNVEQVAEASSEALTVLVRETCTIIGLLAVMLSISWRFTLFFLIAVPIIGGMLHVVSKRVRLLSGRIQDSMGQLTHVVEEVIEGHKVVKAFNGQARALQVFQKVSQHNRQQEMKLIVTSAIHVPLIQCVGSVALAATIYLATVHPDHALKTAMTPGAFAAMMMAMVMLLKPLKQLTRVNHNIQRGIAGASSIFDFLDEKPEKDKGSQTLSKAKGHVVFQEVSFRFPEKKHNTLEAVSFEIRPAETVAVVGRSGAGKSTLVSLLARFYEASGLITLDGIDIRDLPLETLRSAMAIVTQQVTLFNDTIANNIAYGKMGATLEEVKAAAQAAYVTEFTNRLPQGLETWVGENGIRLSGGQRQRIAIARAFVKGAPILILDEATSALDTASERYIQASLRALMAQCTTLVIAHRLSTIEQADRILVMERGKIVEVGTHASLMHNQALYASLQSPGDLETGTRTLL